MILFYQTKYETMATQPLDPNGYLRKRLLLQEKVLQMTEINVSWFNVFNKKSRSLRKEPDRYAIAVTLDTNSRKILKEKLAADKILCKDGSRYNNIESGTPYFSYGLKIDLDSITIPTT